MELSLIVAKGKQQGMSIPLKVDLFLMGSDPMCQLRSKLPGIAPQHCAVVTRDEKVFVRDMEGGQTLLNGEAIPPGAEWPAHSGDRLAVGPLEFTFDFKEADSAQRDADEWTQKTLDHVRKDRRDTKLVKPASSPPPNTAAAAAAAILEKLSGGGGTVKGRLRVIQENDVTLIRFNDANLVEDSEITYIKKELLDNVQGEVMRVLIDFKNVERMSSAAAAMVMECWRRLRAKGGSLALCQVRPELHLVLETLNVFPAVPHFSNEKLALRTNW